MAVDSLISASQSNLFAIGIVIVAGIIVWVAWKSIGGSENSDTPM